MYRCIALNCGSDHVFDVFLQWIFTLKKIGKPVLHYMVMFEKWNVFSDFSMSLKSILSVPAIHSCRALNSASDHVFDVFLQWIFTFKKFGKPVVQYMVMLEDWNFCSDFSGF